MSGSKNLTNKASAKRGSTVTITKASEHAVSEDLKLASRSDLQNEVLQLREALKAMKRGETTDKVSGLYNRSSFLEQANAEYSRTRRYEHDMSLVVTDIIGLNKIASEHGTDGVDHVIMAVAQMCVSSSRYGVDILGRISDHQIAILLPETALAGGLQFMARMRKIITTTPIFLPSGGRVKPGLKVSADMLKADDDSFIDLFQRTWKRTAPKKNTVKAA